MSTVRDEVCKAGKKLNTAHIIYSATVGKQLLGAMPESKVLTLRSWDSKTAAVFAFLHAKSSTLLWRSVAVEDHWYEFPGQETMGDVSVTERATVVEVRPGLEVIIPHHDVVQQLVGKKMFDSLVALSKGDDSSSAVGTVVTTLVEVLGSEQLLQQHQQDQEQKHDDGHVFLDTVAGHVSDKPVFTFRRKITNTEEYASETVLIGTEAVPLDSHLITAVKHAAKCNTSVFLKHKGKKIQMQLQLSNGKNPMAFTIETAKISKITDLLERLGGEKSPYCFDVVEVAEETDDTLEAVSFD